MLVRWKTHRYLLRQSLGFFQDEFAGRIATRVMQTSLAVRSTVIKLLDIMVYVSVYFLSVLVLLGTMDLRLMLPMLFWLICYIGLLYVIVPRLQRISEKQADARATMTGRIADSYTNISTVKLFSHARPRICLCQRGDGRFYSAQCIRRCAWSPGWKQVSPSTTLLCWWLWV